MSVRDGIFAVAALALSSAALAAVLSSDAYSQAAQAEASGYDALTHQVSQGERQVCLNNSGDIGRTVAQ